MQDLTNSLTPFVRHNMQNAPGYAGAPEATGGLLSPPLGKPPLANENKHANASSANAPQPRPQQDQAPLATPHPGQEAAPRGTAVPCHQKNAADFLAGNTPGVMAYYDPGSPDSEKGHYERKVQNAPPQAAVPAQEDEDVVRHLVEWREEATY